MTDQDLEQMIDTLADAIRDGQEPPPATVDELVARITAAVIEPDRARAEAAVRALRAVRVNTDEQVRRIFANRRRWRVEHALERAGLAA